MSEFDLIDKIITQNQPHPAIEWGPGDDCAIIKDLSSKTLVTADTLMDGTHFILSALSPEEIAHKAVCVNLSDIAAMGGTPDYMIVALCLPQSLSGNFCDRFFHKISALCQTHNFGLAGGDTNTWQGPLVISITLVGRPHPRGPVLRSGGKPGDEIFVSGPLGGSLQGHHFQFTPRLQLAKRLLDTCQINSMIDLSDGLAGDLRHILRASNVGATLNKDQLPARHCLRDLPRSEQIAHMLSDGEDFELCFTLDPSEARKVQLWPELFPIGQLTAKSGLHWSDGSEIMVKGYEHMLDSEHS